MGQYNIPDGAFSPYTVVSLISPQDGTPNGIDFVRKFFQSAIAKLESLLDLTKLSKTGNELANSAKTDGYSSGEEKAPSPKKDEFNLFNDNDIKDLKIDSEKLYKLNPVSYNYKISNSPDIGLIAEEVHEILPELINYGKDGKPKSVKYNSLSVVLLDELKKLREEIQELKENK